MDAVAETRRRGRVRTPIDLALGRTLLSAILDGNFVDVAAQLSYWTLLAMFPFVVAVLTVVAFMPFHGLDLQLMTLLRELMPPEVAVLCESVIRDVVGHQRGFLLVVSVGAAVWMASGSVSAFMLALDDAWRVRESRSWVHRKAIALGITVVGALGLTVVLVALGGASELGARLLARGGIHVGFGVRLLVRWGVASLAMLGLAALSYRLLPDLRGGPRYILPGALLASSAWVLVSFGFGLYVTRLGTYTRVYGALGTAVVLLTWLYLGAFVLLLGGGLNAALEAADDAPSRGGKTPR